MSLQETKQIGSLHVVHLAVIEYLSGCFVIAAVNSRAQPENIARLADIENYDLAVSGTSRQFDLALAKHVNALYCLALDKEVSSLWKGLGYLYGFELFEIFVRKPAEKIALSQAAAFALIVNM